MENFINDTFEDVSDDVIREGLVDELDLDPDEDDEVLHDNYDETYE